MLAIFVAATMLVLTWGCCTLSVKPLSIFAIVDMITVATKNQFRWKMTRARYQCKGTSHFKKGKGKGLLNFFHLC